MECPICFEPITSFYKLTGCSHILCMTCACRCKFYSHENPITVESTFDLSIYVGVKKCIKCPLCRTIEKKMTLAEFEHLYPDLFKDWTHSELTWNELIWGYDELDEHEDNPEPKKTRRNYTCKYYKLPSCNFKRHKLQKQKHRKLN